jgi:G3E family GTPase
VFTSWGVETPKTFSREELDCILNTLCDENSKLGVILRSKGIVKASDNEKWYYFDLVAGEYEIRLGEPDYTGKLCVIGSKLDEEKINKLFLGE